MTEPTPGRGYRLSDAERDEALLHLRTALQEGRLDLDEHERRSETALHAVTDTDLRPLFDDLPRALWPASMVDGPTAENAPVPSKSPTPPAERDDDHDEVDRKNPGRNVGALMGWGGFLLLVWGVPTFIGGDITSIAVFLGVFCLIVIGPLVGQIAYNRRHGKRGGPREIDEG
ncbi:DUF1707 domain-containing protein [Nocardiopsis alba]|uniref:DUF1707 domain-containing protein n=1 Tax=Nocardiopsis alba TaxID=53437 RepID=A0A7K2IUJ6_9ACTN|nr:DUF1707 domain-containing protein [Nocardiopsis alba]MYR33642.1 DUF1707 domain-containing protein [Nocardiopsis alba]